VLKSGVSTQNPVSECYGDVSPTSVRYSAMSPVTFDRWVEAVFDHPLRTPEWYWDNDFDEHWDCLGLTASLTVEYLTRLFSDPDHLKRYSLQHVAQGMWFLIGESSPGDSAYALLNCDVPLNQRIDCVRAMSNFFRVFVAPAAPGTATERKDDFQGLCYMWWDILPTYGGPKYGNNTGGEPELHRICLDTMADILTIPSELCQLSALHGLNHWHLHHAERVQSIVDAFLQKTSGLTPRMVEYAAIARSGSAQ
jgi:hypothetical protein